MISPRAYKFVRVSGYIILPHPSTIHKISLGMDINPQKELDDKQFLNYVKQQFCHLEKLATYVVLMMDEIHIKQFLDYKGGDIHW